MSKIDFCPLRSLCDVTCCAPSKISIYWTM